MDRVEKSNEKSRLVEMKISARPGTIVEKIPSAVWHDAQQQVQKLVDQRTTLPEKELIALDLLQLLQKMASKSVLQTNVPSHVEIRVRMADAVHDELVDRGTDEFNERLRRKIAEFNQGLASLGDGIARLKDKLLAFEYRPHTPEIVDVNVYRNIHRNFRRILQRESRFLRDELFSARDTIYRLERRSPSVRSPSESVDQNGKLIPYNEFTYHPTNFVNTETVSQQMWISPNGAPYAGYSDFGERLYYNPEFRTNHYESFPNARDAGHRIPICYSALQVARPIPEQLPSIKKETQPDKQEGSKGRTQPPPQ